MDSSRPVVFFFKIFCAAVLGAALVLHFSSASTSASGLAQIGAGMGAKEAVLIADQDGKILFSKNSDKLFTPASTIKILTVLAGFHYLGKDYRFPTEFYLDDSHNLTIKGYGDPFLVSEEISVIAKRLVSFADPYINEIIVNDVFFSQPLVFSTAANTRQPYGAPNGALSVNFNTVNFKKGPTPESFVSAEPQTPLLPFAVDLIKKSRTQSDRIVLSHDPVDIALYAGEMFRYFLEKNNVETRGKVWRGGLTPDKERLIYKHDSRNTLEQAAKKLLKFSNNFMANQILIAAGAKRFGPPGNFEKGAKTAQEYAEGVLEVKQMTIEEGSGISRKNRISPRAMLKVLDAFRPHHKLLKRRKNAYYKTGTLQGVSNLAGFIESKGGKLYPFVIFINKPGKNAMTVLDKLMRQVN